jgi:hypothetical protein
MHHSLKRKHRKRKERTTTTRNPNLFSARNGISSKSGKGKREVGSENIQFALHCVIQHDLAKLTYLR